MLKQERVCNIYVYAHTPIYLYIHIILISHGSNSRGYFAQSMSVSISSFNTEAVADFYVHCHRGKRWKQLRLKSQNHFYAFPISP